MKKETIERIRRFTKERDWDKFHTPNALAKTIAIESTELLECFQWNEDYKIEKVREELADVIVNCQNLIDKLGLDTLDRRLLTIIAENYSGGPVGVETMAAALGEEAVTIEDVYEPYLMQLGFLQRTPRGRCITASGLKHIGRTLNEDSIKLEGF